MSDFFADLLVASGENNADMRYATRLPLPDPFVYLAFPGHRIAIVSDLEIDRARANAPANLEVVNQAKFGTKGGVVPLLKKAAEKYGLHGFRVPYDFPAGLMMQLHEAGLSCNIAQKLFFPERIAKKEYEIDGIKDAMRATEHAMQAALDAIARAGVANDGKLTLDGEIFTSERLRGLIDADLAAHDAVGAGTIAAGGLQGAMPHNRGEGPLYAGTPIVMDVFPRLNSNGYYGDLTRTVVKGHAPEAVRRAFEAVKTVREECKAMLKIGMAGHVPHDHAVTRLAELGFPTGTSEAGMFGFFHGLGHGVGLEIHEAPRLSHNVEHLLAAGEVVTVEPGVYYPEWGGMRLEDLVVMRERGAECITKIATELEIA